MPFRLRSISFIITVTQLGLFNTSLELNMIERDRITHKSLYLC